MQVRVEKLLRDQDNCVAVWQLREGGIGQEGIAALVRGWRRLHSGTYVATFSEPSARQRWRAATLTTPTSFLSHFSAGACWEISPQRGSIQSVSRPGSSRARQGDNLVVHHSTTLAGHTTAHRGVPITTPERTIIDLSPALDDRARRKLVREALRLRKTTIASLQTALEKHPARRGSNALRKLTTFYSVLQLDRCKSDAEAFAMEVLATARRPLPGVNHAIAGREADLSWPAQRLIIEIDGPQFHRDKLEDAHKTAQWTAAGWTVRRIPSDDIFTVPDRLLALALPDAL